MEDKTVVENTLNIFHAPWKPVEVSNQADRKGSNQGLTHL